jgi:hypothetical protein
MYASFHGYMEREDRLEEDRSTWHEEAFFGEPEAEPAGLPQGDAFGRQVSSLSVSSFGRQVSNLSEKGFCRQVTEEQWSTWGTIAAQGTQPPALNMPWPLFATPAPTASPTTLSSAGIAGLGKKSKLEARIAAESNDDSDEGSLEVKEFSRRRRKGRSLITLAHRAQVRQQTQDHHATPPTASTPPKLAADASHKKQKANFCPYCGGALQPHFKFCLFCGQSIGAFTDSRK